jgi:hypothetical protein
LIDFVRHICLKLVLPALLLACCPWLATAQTGPRADAPSFKVGDRWKFETRDSRTGVKGADLTREIVSVSATQIDALEDGAKATLTPELGTIESASVVITGGNSKPLSFPLEIGKKWEYRFSLRNKVNGMIARWQLEAVVVGFEKMKVAASEFDAFKIQSKGFYNNETTRVNGRIVQTYWYAPAARTIIKSEFDDGYNTSVRELTELQLQP